MPSNQVDQLAREQAERIAQANLSPRYCELDNLERYVDGTQYDHRKYGWFNDAVPLWDRRPAIVYPIAQRAIRSHVDMVLGEGRWPHLTTHPGEDEEENGDDFGLDKESSQTVDRLVLCIAKQAKIRAVADALLSSGLRARTAVAVCCVRDGKITVDAIPAKWCTPTFDDSGAVTSVEIRYPYVEEFRDAKMGKWMARCMLYRRTIDAQRDVTYWPAPAAETGAEPDSWAPQTVIEHNLGFCPVVWYKHMAGCEQAGKIDGEALHEKLLDEIDALNLEFSQSHKAALQAGDPQLIETGVSEGDKKAPKGPPSLWQQGDPAENRRWQTGTVGGYGLASATKKGPGVLWTYENERTKVEYLTLPADALTAIQTDADRLLALLREAMAFVETDPEHSKIGGGELSGKALEWLHQRQVDRDNKEREDFAENCLIPLLGMLLRVAYVMGKRGAGLYLRGLKKALPVLARFERDIEGQGKRWFDPEITVVWGEYFALTEADKKQAQERVVAAKDASLITTEVAVEAIRPFYPAIKDLEAHIEALEDEKSEATKTLHDAQAALAGATDEADEEEPVSSPSKGLNGAPPKTTAAQAAA